MFLPFKELEVQLHGSTNQPPTYQFFLFRPCFGVRFPWETPKKIPKNPKCLTARKGSSSNRLVFRGVHFICEATESGQLAVCLVGEIVKIPSITKKIQSSDHIELVKKTMKHPSPGSSGASDGSVNR